MGNVTLPTPVALAGGAICILGGYLIGVVAGPDTPERTTAVVQSFDDDSGRLCLEGEGVTGHEGVSETGTLCGTWRRTQGATAPEPGDRFRFVSVQQGEPRGGEDDAGTATVIYGDVVG